MSIDPQLTHVLVCPQDKGELHLIEAEDCLYNPRLHRKYAIRDGIPIMLVDEAESVDETEHSRLMSIIDSGGSIVSGR
jgi:uncharacterized protein YbaR (Trm112 family)